MEAVKCGIDGICDCAPGHCATPNWSKPPSPAPTAKIASTGGSTDYYRLPTWATELRHLISYKRMNFNVGNIFKAAYRLGEKSGIDHRYDLNKIILFAQAELEELDRLEGKLSHSHVK